MNCWRLALCDNVKAPHSPGTRFQLKTGPETNNNFQTPDSNSQLPDTNSQLSDTNLAFLACNPNVSPLQ